jgi:hypothetical protein
MVLELQELGLDMQQLLDMKHRLFLRHSRGPYDADHVHHLDEKTSRKEGSGRRLDIAIPMNQLRAWVIAIIQAYP